MDAPFKDPYTNPKRARAILFGVLLMHVGIIAVPLIYASLTEFLDPPVIVMKVGLADLPLGDSPDAGAPADSPATKTSEPDPVSVDDIPDPQHVDDLPPDVPPPPKVEPKTDPEPTVKPPPKTEPKNDPKPTVKPPPKTEPKKDPPKTSNLLKPEDIIRSKNTKTQAQIDAERKAREAAEAKAKADAKARQDLIADIRATAGAGQQPGRFGTTNPGQEGILATKEMRDYYELLNAFIRPKWNAVSPSSVEMDGKISTWPSVDLTIAKDGRITKAVVVSQSGNKAIDSAVKALLANLKVVPAPPQAGVIRVTLDIH